MDYRLFVACVLHCSRTWAVPTTGEQSDLLGRLCRKSVLAQGLNSRILANQTLFWCKDTWALGKKWHGSCWEDKTLNALQYLGAVGVTWPSGGNSFTIRRSKRRSLAYRQTAVPGLKQQIVVLVCGVCFVLLLACLLAWVFLSNINRKWEGKWQSGSNGRPQLLVS